MANPCTISYKGTDYSYEEWMATLHDGLLDTFVQEGSVNLGGKLVATRTRNKDKAIAALKALKVDNRNKMNFFGLLPEAWNTILDAMVVAIEGTSTVAEAIADAIVKAKDLVENFDEAGFRAKMNEIFGGGEEVVTEKPVETKVEKPKVEKAQVEAEEDQEVEQIEGRPKRRFTQQALKEYPHLESALKDGVIYYNKLPNKVTLGEAKAIIEYLGEDIAAEEFEDLTNGMSFPVRMTIGQLLIKRFNDNKEFDRGIEMLEKTTTLATDLGQGIQVLAMFPKLTPEMELRKTQKEINKQKKELKEKAQPKIDAIEKNLAKANEEAIDEVLTNIKNDTDKADTIAPTEAAEKKEYGEANIIISKDKYKAAKKALKGKLFSNLPPELIDVAIYHLEASGRKFTEFAAKMVKDFGGKVKPHLQKLYAKAKQQMLDNGFDESNFENDANLEKEIRAALKEEGTTIENIIKQHYTVAEETKQSLADKLVEQAGLDAKEAADLANRVKKEFDRVASKKKRDILRKIDRKLSTAGKSKVNPMTKSLADELIEMSNTGALTEMNIAGKYAEKMGWPKLTAKDVTEIKRLSDLVQEAPPGLKQFKATEDLLKYQAGIKGISKVDLALSIWYANMLSGYKTQIVNLASNMFNSIGEYAVATAQNPKMGKTLAVGYLNGIQRGLLEAKATWQTGYSPIRGKAEVPATLERKIFAGGNLNPANYLKYVRRAMTAVDVVFFEGLKEMRAYQLAAMMAQQDGKLDPDINVKMRAAEYLGKTDIITNYAKETAEAEYQQEVDKINDSKETESRKAEMIKEAAVDKDRRIYEIIEMERSDEILTDSHAFGARGTYNYKPEGILGWVAAGLNKAGQQFAPVRLVVPFTNIIANVANEAINYTPIGFGRVLRDGSITGFKRKDLATMTQEQKDRAKADIMTKAIIGTAGMTALFLLSRAWDDDDEPLLEITANGTGDYRKNYQLQEAGWQPYSVKIGGVWISYQQTPLLVALSFIGNIRDSEKYRKEKITDKGMYTKMGLAATKSMRTLVDMTFLKNLDTFLGAVVGGSTGGGDNILEDAQKALIATSKSFAVPNLYTQAFKDVQNIFDMPTKEVGTDMIANMLRDAPVARNQYYDKLNVLGEPIIPDTDKVYSMVEDKKLFQLLADKSAFVQPTSIKKVTIYDKTIKAERLVTLEEFYEYSKVRGEYIKKYLNDHYSTLSKKSNEDVQDELTKAQARATKKAKKAISK